MSWRDGQLDKWEKKKKVEGWVVQVQGVVINQIQYTWRLLTPRVPHGSVLWPVWFKSLLSVTWRGCQSALSLLVLVTANWANQLIYSRAELQLRETSVGKRNGPTGTLRNSTMTNVNSSTWKGRTLCNIQLTVQDAGRLESSSAQKAHGALFLVDSELSTSLRCSPPWQHPQPYAQEGSQIEASDCPPATQPQETTSRYCVQFAATNTGKAFIRWREFSKGLPGWSGAGALALWAEAAELGLVQPGEKLAWEGAT